MTSENQQTASYYQNSNGTVVDSKENDLEKSNLKKSNLEEVNSNLEVKNGVEKDGLNMISNAKSSEAISKDSSYPNMSEYQKFISLSRYARWLEHKKRRETWSETVERYVSFMKQHLTKSCNFDLTNDLETKLTEMIKNLKVVPSMRCMMTAGPALARDNIAGFNCSYIAIDDKQCFSEVLYILMCGAGVGFSVERQVIAKLPSVPARISDTQQVITVEDSKLGWAESFQELVDLLYAGQSPLWDTRKVREAGAPLHTFGGRASGPGPLEDLFKFTVEIFKEARGRKLTSIEVHDIICKVGDIVVVGGVRRSALISLSNLSDDRMRTAKSGEWWQNNPHRALANNSAAYNEKPEMSRFMHEWVSLYESKSGERGIFNRLASTKQVEKLGSRRDSKYEFGCNPCSEIILRPNQFCNLSEVIIKADDTEASLLAKVEAATILGTMQASLTDFKYVREIWKKNTEDEALLGVSLTGIMDNKLTSGLTDERKTAKLLQTLREKAIATNKKYAQLLGIKPAAAITCVKPSGTVSQLCDTASGIHPRFSDHYIRRVRMDKSDPLAISMIEKGFIYEDELMHPDRVVVFEFPIAAPKNSIVAEKLSAIEHLNIWKLYQDNWCEHKPSATITIREDEWLAVGDWVYQNFDSVSGVSFLPHSGHSYKQAPYETISEEKYNELSKLMPSNVSWYIEEKNDNTIASQELACSGLKCEIL